MTINYFETLGESVEFALKEDFNGIDLTAELLAKKIKKQLDIPRFSASINLDGAEETAKQITSWHRKQGAFKP